MIVNPANILVTQGLGSGHKLSVEVAPGIPTPSGANGVAQLLSRGRMVSVPVESVKRIGTFPKEALAEVVESTEAADEGRSWVTSAMGSSLVKGVMSNDPLGDWID